MLPSMNAPTRFPARVAIALLTAALCACGGGASTDSTTAATTTSPSTLASVATPQPTGSSTPSPASTPVLSTASQATRLSVATLLFEEKGLSASGQQACSSCHTDSTAHADPAGTVLPMGGLNLAVQGFRSTPSLLYLESNEAFSFDANGQPKGGFTWDGRADSRAAQAALPLLDASEMANTSVQSVAAKVRKLSYFQDFATLFGLSGVSTDQQVFDTLLVALQAYQQQDPDYLLFNSKFDRVLDGQDQFSPQEARGLAIFNDPAKGNCGHCHSSEVRAGGHRPLFTNFGYAALGLPRNPAITANANPDFFDMGLCGPKRSDLASRTDLCGQFRVPSLRNVALTAPYFHNGAVSSLEQAVSFYATRDIDPARWYPLVGGRVAVFNDLPAGLKANVHRGAPFGQSPGDRPLLSPQDVNDLVAFLNTLTDDAAAPPRSPTVGR